MGFRPSLISRWWIVLDLVRSWHDASVTLARGQRLQLTVRWLRPAARAVAAVTPPSHSSTRAGASMGLEELKQRIHNFRLPIRNPRLLLAVKMVYLFTPVVLGYGVMQLVIPDPEELKKVMAPPSEAAAALTKHQKDGLRETLEAARARQAQAQDQK